MDRRSKATQRRQSRHRLQTHLSFLSHGAQLRTSVFSANRMTPASITPFPLQVAFPPSTSNSAVLGVHLSTQDPLLPLSSLQITCSQTAIFVGWLLGAVLLHPLMQRLQMKEVGPGTVRSWRGGSMLSIWVVIYSRGCPDSSWWQAFRSKKVSHLPKTDRQLQLLCFGHRLHFRTPIQSGGYCFWVLSQAHSLEHFQQTKKHGWGRIERHSVKQGSTRARVSPYKWRE